MKKKIGLDHLEEITPYKGGDFHINELKTLSKNKIKLTKLASNENPAGISLLAKKAIQKEINELARYPDSNGFQLKKIISQKYKVPIDWVVLGNGSNDILDLVARALVSPKDSVIFSEYSFAVYALSTKIIGAKGIKVPSKNFGHDLNAMKKAITENTKLIYIANPNNPTGTFLNEKSLKNFIKSVPSSIVIVLDEAYTEYLSKKDSFNSISWIKNYSHLFISRTFSKAYGLAGLRIGFGIGQKKITNLINRVRHPFNVNTLAQVAAISAFKDKDFLKLSIKINKLGYAQITNAFDKLKVKYIPSYANFILFHAGDLNYSSKKIFSILLSKGIIIRSVTEYGLNNWLRVSIGMPKENEKFIKALEIILSKDK